MSIIRGGIIGLGGFFRGVHLPCIRRTAGLKIVAACDRAEAARASAGQLLGGDVRLFADVGQMLDVGGLDAVYVLTNPQAMAQIVPLVAEARLPIFCEKPPSHSSEQTRAMAAACERADVPNQVAFNRRFSPLTARLRQWLSEAGGATRIETVFRRVFTASPAAVVGSAVHAIDLTVSLMGPVRRVMGSRAGERRQAGNRGFCHYHAAMQFASGASGALLYDNRCERSAEEYHLSTVSDDTLNVCQITLHFPTPTKVRQSGSVQRVRLTYRDWGPSGAEFDAQRDTFTLPPVDGNDDELLIAGGYLAEHEAFIDCLRAGRAMSPTFAETVHSMEVAEAIHAGECREFQAFV